MRIQDHGWIGDPHTGALVRDGGSGELLCGLR